MPSITAVSTSPAFLPAGLDGLYHPVGGEHGGDRVWRGLGGKIGMGPASITGARFLGEGWGRHPRQFQSTAIEFCHNQDYGFIEVFAGDAWVSKCMKANGIPTASFDIRFGAPREGKMDAQNLLSDAGFSFFDCIYQVL